MKKTNCISSRKTAKINIIISCAVAAVSAVFIEDPEIQGYLIAIAAADIGYMFLSDFYWKQYDNGMPYNPGLNVKTADFFEAALRYVPLFVKYCVIAIVPTSLFEDNYTSPLYIAMMSVITILFLAETVLFFYRKI